MFSTKLITSKLHKNGLYVLAIACIVASALFRKSIARHMTHPVVKMLTIAFIAATTYISPMIGSAIAGCFVYIVTTHGTAEGFDGGDVGDGGDVVDMVDKDEEEEEEEDKELDGMSD